MQPIQFFAARAEDGALLPGATVDVFVSGSNVRADVFAKADTEHPIANPLSSDGNARVFFYTREPRIDIRIRRAGYVAPLMEGIVTVDPQDALLAAEAAVVRAEAAANSAQVAAQIYPDIAIGLPATAEGGYFSVISPGAEEFLILYRKVAGIPVEIKRYPSADAVSALRELIDTYNGGDSSVAATFIDANRFTLLKLLVDGSLDMLGARLRNAGFGLELADAAGFLFARIGATGSNINGLVTKPIETVGTEFVDEHGFLIGRMSTNKTYFGPQSGQASIALPPFALLDQQLRTDIKQIIEYGQSLARGVQSLPAISLSQPFQNIMLASGVKLRAGEGAYNPSSFVPLVESTGTSEGETPVTAICNGVTRRAVAAGEAVERWVMAGMSPGRSGRSVEQLSPLPMGSSNDFENMVQSIADCKRLADLSGKSYSVWAYSWTQGESNYISAQFDDSPYQYMQYQMYLFDTLTEKIVGITGQKFRPYLFSYQVGAHRRYSRDDMPIALAQWRISRQRDDVVLAVPVYMFPVASDNLHLTNEASWLLGEYKSRAIYETMIRRSGKWRPLEPISVDWKNDHVDIHFHVPRGELVLDTALATLTPNFGFDIREDGVLVPDLITGVAINAPASVRLTLSRPTAVDATLSYARGRPGDAAHSGPVTGARGNLRDTHGLYDTSVSPLGNTFALHNPCVMFQYDRKTGF